MGSYGHRRQAVIYAVFEIETNRVVYVGATENLVDRLRNHRLCCDGMTGEWTREMRKSRKRFGFMVLEFAAKRKAADAERWWIRFYESRGPLINRRGLSGDLNYVESTKRLRAAAVASSGSLMGLGRALGCTAPSLIRAHRGLVPISMKRALKIQAATVSREFPSGFEATVENWPRLRGA
jgi:predicted GIY-YIG superfamily endonuclease